jgi:hypothetical protein
MVSRSSYANRFQESPPSSPRLAPPAERARAQGIHDAQCRPAARLRRPLARVDGARVADAPRRGLSLSFRRARLNSAAPRAHAAAVDPVAVRGLAAARLVRVVAAVPHALLRRYFSRRRGRGRLLKVRFQGVGRLAWSPVCRRLQRVGRDGLSGSEVRAADPIPAHAAAVVPASAWR